jgi:CheY-like chemotaxis protein
MRAIQGLLQDAQHEVICSASGHEGLPLFKEFDPDVVIVDVNLREMTGLQVSRALRQS